MGMDEDDTEPGGFDWLYTAARAQRLLGHSVLLGFWVNEDVRNTSRSGEGRIAMGSSSAWSPSRSTR